ncbi:LysM peptidoglycan-binding domain-containing protein [Archangium lansingense]|uniref:LysM domain-containing protein n=1 Tax=Archangium lansingense TaxID=2995310 RepID=A0ABT4AAJ8_9BACT|nr:LysM domain-containing protein [Archangium lansinium]MCY1078274.1 LysM domain-containing protein [Archangium lansinium]
MAAFGILRPRLRNGEHEYLLLRFHEPLPEGHEHIALGDSWQAERRLREFAQDSVNLRTLRELVYTQVNARPYEPLSEESVLRQAATLLSSKHVRLARAPLPKMPGVMQPREKVEKKPPPEVVEEKLRLMVQIVDDVTEDPITDLELSIKLPDGSKQKVTTDDEGRISLSDVPKGRVDITSAIDGATLAETLAFAKAGILKSLDSGKKRRRRMAPSGKFLARISEHKVSDGETLESIAETYSLTVDQLTKFNWGTTDPEEIQRHLFIDVGCTTKDDTGKFVLSRHDDPGVIYIARPLEMNWVALEDRHIWRVKKVPEPKLYLFSV